MEELEQPSSTLQNTRAALSRYKWYVTIAAILLAITSAAVAVILPPTFQAEGLVLVENQKIPDDLIKSTVQVDPASQIGIIRQRIMTREKLLGIVNKHPYYANMLQTQGESAVLSIIKDNIVLEPVEDTGDAMVSLSMAFRLGFKADTADLSYKVANDIITLFLNENTKTRTKQATETTSFLEAEADRLKKRLDDTEQAIANYKQQNKDALPEHLQLYQSALSREEATQLSLKRDMQSISSQISFLEAQLANPSAPTAAPTASPEAQRLQELKNEYRRLSVIYQPAHPDIVALREEIQYLENGGKVSATPDSSGQTQSTDPATLQLQEKLKSQRQELAMTKQELAASKQKMQQLEDKIVRIPQVERQLISLNRDYEAVNNQYTELTGNIMKARMAQNLEEDSKAERFTLLEPPVMPLQAAAPNRKLILAGGIGISLAIPFGIIFLIGFMDKSIRGAATLEAIVGQTPLVVVPLIPTAAEKAKARNVNFMIAGAIVAVFIVALLAVHFAYMPLDLLFSKVAMRF